MALLMLAACGKKGDPTLTTFVKPPPVKNITVVHRENSILLSWSYSPPPDMQELIKGFYVEKAVGAGDNNPGEFKKMVFLPGTVNHYADTDFEAGRPYFYKIRVYSVRNIISDQSAVVKVIPAALPPPPQGLSFEVKNDSVEIRWNKMPGKVKYNIYRSNKQNVFPESLLNKALSEPLFIDKVETGASLYYVVTSLLDTDIKDEGFPSKVLEVDPATFVPSKPSGLKYVYAPKGVALMWKENPESWVKQYRVYRKRAGESSYSIIGEAVTPTFKDNESVTSKTLYYITALGPSRESAGPEPIEVSPLVER
jgi:fibronectin type 3 domain-containing protein